MKIDYSRQFQKQYAKLPKKIQMQYKQRTLLFLENPKHPELRIHKLSGEYAGLWSMNITGDIRAIFDKSVTGVMLFIAIGSHSELYS